MRSSRREVISVMICDATSFCLAGTLSLVRKSSSSGKCIWPRLWILWSLTVTSRRCFLRRVPALFLTVVHDDPHIDVGVFPDFIVGQAAKENGRDDGAVLFEFFDQRREGRLVLDFFLYGNRHNNPPHLVG